MKSTILGALVLVASVSFGQTEKPFSIKGTLQNIPGTIEKVYLNYSSNGERKSDSSLIENGKYNFKGTLPEAVMATLRLKYAPAQDGTPTPSKRKDVATIFLSPSKVQATSIDSFANVKVLGSPAHTAYLKLEAQLKPYTDKSAALDKQWMALEKTDTEGKKKLEVKYDEVDKEMRAEYGKYAEANPNSPIAVYAVSQLAGYDIDADKVQPVFDKLSAATKKLPSAVTLNERIDIARKTGVGRMAMDFTQNDTLGTPVSLSSLRGKVLLVDFWASWCGPCRRENPNVVKAFNEYKEKGFHVLGVSLDQPGAKEKWMKAIHDDNLTWTHVSDLKYWDNEAAKEYGIRGIPYNLLLDKEGKIIGKNLRGEDLEKKLAEVFPN